MKKVVCFVGSARTEGGTQHAVRIFEERLREHGEIDFEILRLSEQNLSFCTGCKLCFDRGEQYCPHKDDRERLVAKMEAADGVVFASPNYAFHVSGSMKNYIDRIAYVFHRPCFFGKTFTGLAVYGVFGGNKVRKYLESTGENLGFEVVRGATAMTLEPMTEERIEKLEASMTAAADRFYQQLMTTEPMRPSLYRFMMFRMTRSGIMSSPVQLYDHAYYEKQGWFDSDYYYDVKLSGLQRLLGGLFDRMGRSIGKG